MSEPVDAAGELPVGDLLVAAVDGDLVRATGLQVPVDENARVVPLRCLYHAASPLGYRFGAAELLGSRPFACSHRPLDHDRLGLRVEVEGFYAVLLP